VTWSDDKDMLQEERIELNQLKYHNSALYPPIFTHHKMYVWPAPVALMVASWYALRLITATGKFDRGLSQLLHDDLHWLDVPQRVQYKLAVMVHRCLGRRAP